MKFESLERLSEGRRRLRRRRFLWFGLAGTAGLLLWRWWRFRPRPVAQRSTAYVTANRDFFTVSINPAFRPKIDLSSYRLIVAGSEGAERRYSFAELEALPGRIEFRTLACVGNPVGGTGIGNAAWTVTPLAAVLAGVASGPTDGLHVTFHGMDGFYSSVPWEVAVDPDTVLALRMNGEPLPPAHGYPVRVLIPGRYGMKQPRWIERIAIGTEDSGYWERRGWCSECWIRPLSRIDFAGRQGDEWIVRGVAFTGARAVGTVELSDDDGTTWQKANLTSEALSNAWATWEFRWRPRDEAAEVLTVRVTDAAGGVQEDSNSGAFPSGSAGYHRVIVEASGQG